MNDFIFRRAHHGFKWRLLLSLIVCLQWFFPGPIKAVDTNPLLDQWLERQTRIKTWSADVTQIRELKSLTRPLETRGQVWFKQPNQFRWQLGNPPRVIAVRNNEALMVVYPGLKQAERYPIGDVSDPAWKQALVLLEVGFPTDKETFYARYEVVSARKIENTLQFELRPAEKAAQRLLEAVRIIVNADNGTLLETELVFPDGSSMKNRFSNHHLNPVIDESLFHLDLGKDYRIVEPLKR